VARPTAGVGGAVAADIGAFHLDLGDVELL
jgi:hypothetical protein